MTRVVFFQNVNFVNCESSGFSPTKRSKQDCKKQGQKMFAVNFLIMSKRPTCFLYV